MWAAEKTTSLERQSFDPLSLDLMEAISALWVGSGSESDEVIAGAGLERLHKEGKWIACDCRADEGVFPLMAPAYLRAFGTFYLRRLYGKTRPLHHKDCIFHGEPWLGADRLIEHESFACPDGFFEIEDPLQGAMEAEKGVSLGEGAREPRLYTDRLRLQLWRLMERARLGEIAPPVRTIKPSYVHEYAKLKDAAERLHVSTGQPLSKVFETAPQAIARKSIFAKVRQLIREEPKSAGQGFLAFMAKDVTRERIVTKTATIKPLAGVDVIHGGAPYLVLILIGQDQKGALQPIKATAQPILSGRRFFPIFAEEEREWVEAMITEQFRLLRVAPHIGPGLRRPLFEEDGSKPLLSHTVDLNTGKSIVKILNFSTPLSDVYKF